MSDRRPGEPTDGPAEPVSATMSEAERRRRRARVFGDALPEVTGDERGDDGDGRRGEGDAGEEWLRRQVPPHHGG